MTVIELTSGFGDWIEKKRQNKEKERTNPQKMNDRRGIGISGSDHTNQIIFPIFLLKRNSLIAFIAIKKMTWKNHLMMLLLLVHFHFDLNMCYLPLASDKHMNRWMDEVCLLWPENAKNRGRH